MVTDRYRGLVERLETSLAETDIETVRAELRTLYSAAFALLRMSGKCA